MSLLNKLTWLGHATFKLELDKTVYIDPWKIREAEEADIILISHSHYDHLSKEDIEKLRGSKTQIIGAKDVAKELDFDVIPLTPGESVGIGSLEIIATAAYNIGKDFHPEENQWLGFIIKSDEGTIYYAGDTDVIPEFEEIAKHGIDIALLPVGGKYTMRPKEAAEAAEILKPKIAVPYHYGDVIGTATDARRFKSHYSGTTEILPLKH